MNKPSWWTDDDTSTWTRVREALHRDWEQTRHDLHLGGHELNQDAGDTATQAVSAGPIQASDVPNPPRVIARWEDAEIAIGFGFAARTHYGDRYASWTGHLEQVLERDWTYEGMPWSVAKIYVRHGYDVRR